MFHKVDEIPPGARYPGNYVTPGRFDQLLGALRDWGYESIHLDQWLAWRDGAGALPRRPVVITFDDGYATNHSVAWPILARHGMTATIFIVTSQVGGTNAWDSGERQERLLSARHIQEMHAGGIRFGSHTHTHVGLRGLEPRRVRDELSESRRVLADITGEAPTAFCYPFSKFSPEVTSLIADEGYEVAVRGGGRMNRRSANPLGLKRIKVEDHTSPDTLRRTFFRLRYLVP